MDHADVIELLAKMKQLDGKRKDLADFPEDLRVREFPAWAASLEQATVVSHD